MPSGAGGRLAGRVAGAQRINGRLDFAGATSRFVPRLKADPAASDALTVRGAVTLNGAEQEPVFDGPAPAAGTQFTVLDTTAGVTGKFAGLSDPTGEFTSASGQRFAYTYNGGADSKNVVLTFLGGVAGVPDTLLVGGNGAQGVRYTATGGALGTPERVELIPGFGGSVRTAVADINGVGKLDLIAVTGPGGGRVRVLDGDNPATVLADFRPFGEGFTDGLNVAAGDLAGDPSAEVAVAPDIPAGKGGIGPIVRVYSGSTLRGANPSPTLLTEFNGIASLNGQSDPTFKGGARVAVGDITGDGKNDLVVGAGTGGGPRLTAWPNAKFGPAAADVRPVANLFVFEEGQRGGAWVAVGNLDGDEFADIVVGGGPGGGPRIRSVSSQVLVGLPPDRLENVRLDDEANLSNGLLYNNFFVGDDKTRGGIRPALRDVDGDDLADLVVGGGDGLSSVVTVFKGTALRDVRGRPGNAVPAGAVAADPFGGQTLPNGVFVG